MQDAVAAASQHPKQPRAYVRHCVRAAAQTLVWIVGCTALSVLAVVLLSLAAGSASAATAPVPSAAAIAALQSTLNHQQSAAFAEDDLVDQLTGQQGQIRALVGNTATSLYELGQNDTSFGSLLAAGGLHQFLATESLIQQEADGLHRMTQESEDMDASVERATQLRDSLLANAAVTIQELDSAEARVAAHDAAKAAKQRATEQRAQAVAAKQRAALQASLAALTTVPTSVAYNSQIASYAEPSTLMLAASVLGSSGPVTASSIDVYLASKASPMTGSGAFFVASGSRWGVDPRLIVAIAGAESNFGSQLCGPYNAWGWSCPGNPAAFANWGQAIDTVASGLRANYMADGLTTVAAIQTRYAPSAASNDPTGLNDNWVANVTKFLMEQGGNPNAVDTQLAVGGSPAAGGATTAAIVTPGPASAASTPALAEN